MSRLAAVLAATATVLSLAACSAASVDDPADEAASDTASTRFVDVAADVGLDFRHGAFRWAVSNDPAAMMGGGLCWLDFDEDGRLDLYVVNSYAEDEAARWRAGRTAPECAVPQRRRRVRRRERGVRRRRLRPRHGLCGRRPRPRRPHRPLRDRAAGGVLLWNNGDGTFLDGTAVAGVGAPGWYAGAAVGDVNGDGWPDLFVAGYASLGSPIPDATLGFPNTYTGVRDLLYVSGVEPPAAT